MVVGWFLCVRCLCALTSQYRDFGFSQVQVSDVKWEQMEQGLCG